MTSSAWFLVSYYFTLLAQTLQAISETDIKGLAGAQPAQVASTLYRNGLGVVSELNERLVSWMQERGPNHHSFDKYRHLWNNPTLGEKTVACY